MSATRRLGRFGALAGVGELVVSLAACSAVPEEPSSTTLPEGAITTAPR